MLSCEQTHSIHPAKKVPDRNKLLGWAGRFFLANSFIALLITLRHLTAMQFPDGDYTITFNNYNQFAVMEKDRLTATDKFGNVDILDEHYRSISDARLSGTLMLR